MPRNVERFVSIHDELFLFYYFLCLTVPCCADILVTLYHRVPKKKREELEVLPKAQWRLKETEKEEDKEASSWRLLLRPLVVDIDSGTFLAGFLFWCSLRSSAGLNFQAFWLVWTVTCAMLAWLVSMHLALCSLLASPGPDALHHVRFGPEGQCSSCSSSTIAVACPRLVLLVILHLAVWRFAKLPKKGRQRSRLSVSVRSTCSSIRARQRLGQTSRIRSTRPAHT